MKISKSILILCNILFLSSCFNDSSYSDGFTNFSLFSDLEGNIISDNCDSISLKVRLKEHAINFFDSDLDIMQNFVSELKVNAIQKWWDSLPDPLQKQIKSQDSEIEIITNVQSLKNSTEILEKTDQQIENTGAIIEKIIGKSMDMTYTVNTKYILTEQSKDEIAQTSIIPVVKVPTDLNQFNSELALSSNGISSQNIHSLQFWWINLPDDLKIKIQNREIIIDLICIYSDKVIDSFKSNKSEEYELIVTDLLHEMIGLRKIKNKIEPLAIINSTSLNERNKNFNSTEYTLKIKLKVSKNSVNNFLPVN